MSKQLALVCGLLIGAAAFAGCGGDDSTGLSEDDSGTTDSGKTDAATHDGSVIPDSSTTDAQNDTTQPIDGGVDATHDASVDSSTDAPADAIVDAMPIPDATSDGGSSATSAQIQAVRNAIDTATDGGTDAGTLPIQGAFVTYVKPLFGTDVAGFFVQAEKLGPAIFVAVDAATLSPVPVAGDLVSFDVTAFTKLAGVREVTAIANFTRQSQGHSLTSLVQDVSSATDLVTAVDSYESELVSVTGATISGTFASAGSGFMGATLDTTAITANALLKFRVPNGVHDALDLATGCVVAIPGAPLWRNNTTSEPSGWVNGDVTVMTCPAPKVVSAIALSATSVQITFDRLVAPASVNVNGSQFTFTNGLTASAAAVSGKNVTVTTSAQTGGTSYTATVATSVTDTHGAALNAANTTATFNGYQAPAVLLINEVNPNITGGLDLIELRVVTAGTTGNIKIVQDVASPTTLATLPGISVAVGDLIVVHLTPGTVTSETTTKTDCAVAACYATAWDVAGGNTGITFSNRVLRVIAPDGTTVQDAVPFVKALSGSPTGFPADLQTLQGAALWLPANCGGALCTYSSTPHADDATISVDWTNVANSSIGMSVQRHVVTDNNVAADWQLAIATFGLTNL